MASTSCMFLIHQSSIIFCKLQYWKRSEYSLHLSGTIVVKVLIITHATARFNIRVGDYGFFWINPKLCNFKDMISNKTHTMLDVQD